jgi:hypothetical protein
VQQQQQEQEPGRLAWHEKVLLGAALLQRLQPLLADDFFVAGSLLSLLLSCHGATPAHRPGMVHELLQLMQLSLDKAAFECAVASLLLHLSRRCKTAPLRCAELPHSGSYALLALMNSLVQLPAVKVRASAAASCSAAGAGAGAVQALGLRTPLECMLGTEGWSAAPPPRACT